MKTEQEIKERIALLTESLRGDTEVEQTLRDTAKVVAIRELEWVLDARISEPDW